MLRRTTVSHSPKVRQLQAELAEARDEVALLKAEVARLTAGLQHQHDSQTPEGWAARLKRVREAYMGKVDAAATVEGDNSFQLDRAGMRIILVDMCDDAALFNLVYATLQPTETGKAAARERRLTGTFLLFVEAGSELCYPFTAAISELMVDAGWISLRAGATAGFARTVTGQKELKKDAVQHLVENRKKWIARRVLRCGGLARVVLVIMIDDLTRVPRFKAIAEYTSHKYECAVAGARFMPLGDGMPSLLVGVGEDKLPLRRKAFDSAVVESITDAIFKWGNHSARIEWNRVLSASGLLPATAAAPKVAAAKFLGMGLSYTEGGGDPDELKAQERQNVGTAVPMNVGDAALRSFGDVLLSLLDIFVDESVAKALHQGLVTTLVGDTPVVMMVRCILVTAHPSQYEKVEGRGPEAAGMLFFTACNEAEDEAPEKQKVRGAELWGRWKTTCATLLGLRDGETPTKSQCCQTLGGLLGSVIEHHGPLHFQINGVGDLFEWFKPVFLAEFYSSVTGVALPNTPKLKTEFYLLLGLECAWVAIEEWVKPLIHDAIRLRRKRGLSTVDLRVLLNFFGHRNPLEVHAFGRMLHDAMQSGRADADDAVMVAEAHVVLDRVLRERPNYSRNAVHNVTTLRHLKHVGHPLFTAMTKMRSVFSEETIEGWMNSIAKQVDPHRVPLGEFAYTMLAHLAMRSGVNLRHHLFAPLLHKPEAKTRRRRLRELENLVAHGQEFIAGLVIRYIETEESDLPYVTKTLVVWPATAEHAEVRAKKKHVGTMADACATDGCSSPDEAPTNVRGCQDPKCTAKSCSVEVDDRCTHLRCSECRERGGCGICDPALRPFVASKVHDDLLHDQIRVVQPEEARVFTKSGAAFKAPESGVGEVDEPNVAADAGEDSDDSDAEAADAALCDALQQDDDDEGGEPVKVEPIHDVVEKLKNARRKVSRELRSRSKPRHK